MTEQHCNNAMSKILSSTRVQAEIRAGIFPADLRTLLPEERDRKEFAHIVDVVNEKYKHMDPQHATDADRRQLVAMIGDYVVEHIEKTYHQK